MNLVSVFSTLSFLLCMLCSTDAGEVYFTELKVCCGNRTFDRYRDGVEFGCCNGREIRLDTHICCDDTTFPRPREGVHHLQCCGNMLINSTTEICCRNQNKPELVNRHPRFRHIGCCGHLVLDSTLEQCYWNKNGSPVLVGINEAYCDGKTIKLRKQTCCNGKIYNKPHYDTLNMKKLNPRASCCGTTGFDPMLEKCCLFNDPAGSIIPNKEELQCCPGKNTKGYFNTTSELCCDGHKVTKTSKHAQCCGSQTINGKTQGCCSSQPFEKKTHFCCEGVPSGVMLKGQESVCCGGKLLQENYLCCGNTQVKKTSDTDDKCCQHIHTFQYTTYTSSEMDCYSGRLETRISAKDEICNDRRFLPSKATCCNGTVHHFPEGDTIGCCHRWDLTETPFSHKHQLCCDGNVYNMSENEAECCHGKAYPKMADNNPCTEKCGNTFHNKESTICCGRRVHNKKTEGDACCGNVSFFSHNATCCQGTLYNDKHVKCCGAVKYNHKTHRCCGDYVAIQRKSKTERCCKNFMVYNKKHGRCLSSGLVKPKRNATPLKNICHKKTWKNLSGIQLDVCFQKIAIRCVILRKEYHKDTSEHVFTMRCKNLKRHLNMFHESFAVQDKSDRLKMTITSSKHIRCSKKKVVGKKVLIFMKQQAIRVSDRMYTVILDDGDAFRLIQDSKQIRQLIKAAETEGRCEQIKELLTKAQKMAYFDQVW